LTACLQGLYNSATLVAGCADDGDEFLVVRHGFSPVSCCSVGNKIRFRVPSLKPI
jgi:hypothetical protein